MRFELQGALYSALHCKQPRLNGSRAEATLRGCLLENDHQHAAAFARPNDGHSLRVVRAVAEWQSEHEIKVLPEDHSISPDAADVDQRNTNAGQLVSWWVPSRRAGLGRPHKYHGHLGPQDPANAFGSAFPDDSRASRSRPGTASPTLISITKDQPPRTGRRSPRNTRSSSTAMPSYPSRCPCWGYAETARSGDPFEDLRERVAVPAYRQACSAPHTLERRDRHVELPCSFIDRDARAGFGRRVPRASGAA